MTIEAELDPAVAAPVGPVVDEQLVAGLIARAGAEGLSVTGEGGLLAQLTKGAGGLAGGRAGRSPRLRQA